MRSLLFTVTLTAAALATAGEAPKNPELEKAQKALAAKKYPEALKQLDAAEKKGGLDVDSYATLLESKALALASTKKVDAATEEFKKLLALDPRRDLAGKYKGDVVRALDAALSWVGQAGGNQLAALEPEAAGGRVKRVNVQVKNDPLQMVKAVRFHLKDGKTVEAVPANGVASADADGESVEFWAEALDDKKNQVELLGSAIRPIAQAAPAAPVAVAEKPKPAEKAAAAPVAEAPKEDVKLVPADKEPDATLTDEPKKKNVGLRGVSYALLGAGVISAGVGAYFGINAQSSRSQILTDQMAGTFSQQVLYDRDQAAIGQAKIANALFITAAAVAVIGVILFVISG